MEINITEAPVKQAVSGITSSAQALTSEIAAIEGKNQLKSIEKINEITSSYVELLNQYQVCKCNGRNSSNID